MKKLVLILVLTFVLNFFWEIFQAFLYAPHYVGITGLIWVHFRASLGDVFVIFIILSLDAIIFRNFYTRKRSNAIRFLAIIFMGLVLATLIEKYALTTGRWSYNSLMPIVPWLNVGLIPILQMILIPSSIAFIFLRPKNN